MRYLLLFALLLRTSSADVLCGRGTYSMGTGSSICLNCAAGSYFTGVGAQTADKCVFCTAGTFLDLCNSPSNMSSASPPIRYSCSSGNISRLEYGSDEFMQAIIAPLGATSVTLTFSKFTTESYDFLYVAQCANAQSCSLDDTLLLARSGTFLPSAVTSTTGAMLLVWVSDNMGTASGWSASWTSTGVDTVGSCFPCSSGSYFTGSGATVCTSCNAGSYYTGSGAIVCDLCGLGTYSTVQSASLSGTCTPCSAGSYSTSTGSFQCLNCAAGTYSTSQGGTSSDICTPCTSGGFSTALGMTSNLIP